MRQEEHRDFQGNKCQPIHNYFMIKCKTEKSKKIIQVTDWHRRHTQRKATERHSEAEQR